MKKKILAVDNAVTLMAAALAIGGFDSMERAMRRVLPVASETEPPRLHTTNNREREKARRRKQWEKRTQIKQAST